MNQFNNNEIDFNTSRIIPGCSNLLPGAGFNLVSHFHCPHKLNRCTKSFSQPFTERFTEPVEQPTRRMAPGSLSSGIGLGGGAYSGNEGTVVSPRSRSLDAFSTGYKPLRTF